MCESTDERADDDSRSVASLIMSRSGDVMTNAFSRRKGVAIRPSESVVFDFAMSLINDSNFGQIIYV